MSGYCIKVPARSTKWIRSYTEALRDALEMNEPYFKIVWFMDTFLLREFDGYEFEVVGRAELGSDAGRTYPDQGLVQIRSDVYDDAASGGGFGRFTMAHELGHLFMHRGIGFARHVERQKVADYCNSEVQANRFAAELLMPVSAVETCKGVRSLQQLCGVSRPAAGIRFKDLREEGLIA